MELLTRLKTEYLLDVPLEALHAETLAWLNELGFWVDEMSFFYKLIHHDKFSSAFPSEQVADIEKELISLKSEKLDRLRAGIASHERLLASLFNPPSSADDQTYRDNHRRLHTDMFILQEEIRRFKQRIFSFYENDLAFS